MKEYGGYLPLEIVEKNEYYREDNGYTAWRVNSGRSAIVAALRMHDVNRVFIPYYNCHVVEDTLISYGYSVEKYKINSNFMPILDNISLDDWIIYIDYFGICKEQMKEKVLRLYKNVIFDNTQAFFSKPIIGDNIFNVYSCRKFFGVSDGAYIISNRKENIDKQYDIDLSWERCTYLIKSYETGTNGAYKDNLQSEENIGLEVKLMSKFTKKLLGGIDYNFIKEKRNLNYNYLVKQLQSINKLKLDIDDNIAPMVYPLLIHNDELRLHLINNKVYVPQWWRYLIEQLSDNDFEVELSKYLFPIPIDQRYTLKDMNEIVNIIIQGI